MKTIKLIKLNIIFNIVFTSALQCLIMSNYLRAENRRHRENERNQARRDEMSRRCNERD